MKVIKRLAITGIIFCIIGVVAILVSFFSNRDKIDEVNSRFGSKDEEITQIVTDLDIESTEGSIYIKQYGDKTKVTVDDCCLDNLSIEVVNGVLTVKQKFPETVQVFGWDLPAFLVGVNSKHDTSITITLPEDLKLNKSYVCMGNGNITVTSMDVKEPVFHLGIGSLQASSITGCTKSVRSQVIFGTRHYDWLD